MPWKAKKIRTLGVPGSSVKELGDVSFPFREVQISGSATSDFRGRCPYDLAYHALRCGGGGPGENIHSRK